MGIKDIALLYLFCYCAFFQLFCLDLKESLMPIGVKLHAFCLDGHEPLSLQYIQ